MTSSPVARVVKRLRKTVLRREEDTLSDGQLLDRYLEKRDEAAFAALVRRHGPMVWGVCRRIVRHAADAEDAFQAAFLILVRKAAAIKPREAVGNWLYGVAYHTALKARTVSGKVHAKEKQVMSMPEPVNEPRETREELLELLDQELSALAEKYRLPVVLCDLEGRTRKEVAAQLKIPEGTLSSRLATAHQMLAKRLARHGLAVSGASLAALFAQNAASACVPASVVSSTIKTATLVAASNAAGVVSTKVAGLAEGVIRVMFLTKLKTVTAMLLVVGMIAFGAGLLVHHTAAGEQTRAEESGSANRQAAPPQEPAVQPAPNPVDDVKAGEDRPIHSLSGHVNRVTSVAYSPDGTSIATASWDGTARIWNAKTGKEVGRLGLDDTKGARLQPGEPGSNTFHQIAFSPDNAFIVTVFRESTDRFVVIVWNRRTGDKVHTFPADGASFAISPDGSVIACGGYRLIRLYELANGKLVREIHGDEKQLHIATLTFSPDGKSLISTGHPPTPQRGDGVERLTIMPDVSRVWDVATGKERTSALNGLVVGRLGQDIALSPDGRTLVHRSGNDIALREAATGGERAKLTGHKSEVCDYAFLPDGRTVASGSMDGTVRLWDLPGGKELGRFGKEVVKGGWVLSVAFSPDGRSLVAGGLNKTADIWDVSRIAGRPRVSAERSSAELEGDWKDLGGDAAKAYAALGRLISSPKQAVAVLGKHLQSVKPADPKRIGQLIGKLDDARFEVRQQATKELEALGEYAVPLVQKALAGKPALEAKQRLEALLDRLEGGRLSAETLSHIRAVEALEFIGNPEALRLLEKLAAGPAEMRLTQEAFASARRLAKRPSNGP